MLLLSPDREERNGTVNPPPACSQMVSRAFTNASSDALVFWEILGVLVFLFSEFVSLDVGFWVVLSSWNFLAIFSGFSSGFFAAVLSWETLGGGVWHFVLFWGWFTALFFSLVRSPVGIRGRIPFENLCFGLLY